ncbi:MULTISPECIES: ApeA N-terminal domain 1-containing protein [unclassified Microcoleus]|uniref:ApeA N-terminal domain 1-containing protein n=1 Tax=unclassified Microcoleus TaxID=2642155 RepID=UPI002FCF6F8B
MRIKEEFKKSGYFWLPSAPQRQIPGTLIITDGGNIELEVLGLFDEIIEGLNKAQNGKYELERIIGHIEKHGLVTLDNCFYKNAKIVFNGISKSSFYVNQALLGVAYDEKEIVSLNTFKFSVEGIDEWVGLTGIKVENQWEKRTASITYSQPEDISLNLKNGMNLLITFSPTLLGYPNTTEAKITQKTYFKLVSEQERPLNDFTSAAYKITTLLGFAIDKTVCLDQVSVTSDAIRQDMGNNKTVPVSISVYYASQPYTEIEPKIEWHRMLFRFGQIREDAERIVNNWFDAYEVIDPALDLYFSIKTGAYKYFEGKFLALAQGLETYHRRTSNEKLMDEAVFKELTENLIKQCPEKNQKWLSGRLEYGNELNLRKRIKNIIEPFKDFIGTKKQRKKLITTIVDTRNYLTHYNEALESKAASGRDLWLLCLKMEAIFQLHLLQVLGFTPAEVESVFHHSHELQQKLKEI